MPHENHVETKSPKIIMFLVEMCFFWGENISIYYLIYTRLNEGNVCCWCRVLPLLSGCLTIVFESRFLPAPFSVVSSNIICNYASSKCTQKVEEKLIAHVKEQIT